jgi:hypothetical protein
MFGMLFGNVKLLLKEYLATLGIQIPDGRTRQNLLKGNLLKRGVIKCQAPKGHRKVPLFFS